jgi:hypothetical protein
MRTACMRVGRAGDTAIRVCTMAEAHAPVLTRATAWGQSLCIPGKAWGRCDAVGGVRIGAWHQRTGPRSLGVFACVQTVRKRGQALLGARIELRVS